MGGKAKGQFNLFHSHFVFAMHPPKILLWLLPLVCAFSLGALADTAVDPSQALHLLSYLAADYPPTVADGKIVDPSEYQEQVEFVGNLQALVLTLPMRPERAELERGVASLRQAIEQRLPGRDVALQARNLRARVADIYQVVQTPRSPRPEPRGADLCPAVRDLPWRCGQGRRPRRHRPGTAASEPHRSPAPRPPEPLRPA